MKAKQYLSNEVYYEDGEIITSEGSEVCTISDISKIRKVFTFLSEENSELLQEELGIFIADAINEKINRGK